MYSELQEHPKRSALAQKAYTDFLRGLEVVGAQEHVETAQFKIPKPGIEARNQFFHANYMSLAPMFWQT